MMAEHLRSLQTAACDTSRLPVAGTEPGGAINADYTPAWAGLPNFASVGIATAGQRQTSGHGLVSPAATGWQDPQVYLASAAAGKSPGTYHDIVDFVTKDTIDELVVAGVHEGSQLVVKTGSKAKLESITLSQWSIANLAIMYTLLSSASSRIRFLPVQAQPTATRSSRRAVAHGRDIGRYFYLIILPLLIILLSLK